MVTVSSKERSNQVGLQKLLVYIHFWNPCRNNNSHFRLSLQQKLWTVHANTIVRKLANILTSKQIYQNMYRDLKYSIIKTMPGKIGFLWDSPLTACKQTNMYLQQQKWKVNPMVLAHHFVNLSFVAETVMTLILEKLKHFPYRALNQFMFFFLRILKPVSKGLQTTAPQEILTHIQTYYSMYSISLHFRN